LGVIDRSGHGRPVSKVIVRPCIPKRR
jgi:hypothetical protein